MPTAVFLLKQQRLLVDLRELAFLLIKMAKKNPVETIAEQAISPKTVDQVKLNLRLL